MGVNLSSQECARGRRPAPKRGVRNGITDRSKVSSWLLSRLQPREERPCTPAAVLAEVRRLGLRTPTEATAIVRADRDVG